MLEIKNLTIRLKKDGRNLIENFSFTLTPGDKAVIIGEEGNGKSTLLKCIYDESSVADYCEHTGEILRKGKYAYLPQMIPARDLNRTLSDYFADTEYYLYMNILAKLGLSADFLFSDQKIGTLSGGEKVKVQLAHLLMEDADVLLLDEPTNDLDIPTLQWMEKFIRECRLPVLFISHDETLIENTANVVLHMEQIIRKTRCRITVSRTSYPEYLEHRRLNFSHQEQVARTQRDNYEKSVEKWQRIYNSVNYAQENISRQNPGGGKILKKKMHSLLSAKKRMDKEKEVFVDFPQEEEAILARFDKAIFLPKGKTVLDFSCDRLFAGERLLSRDIHLTFSGNVHIAITGKNGAGKSTLLALLWETLKERTDITASFMPQNYGDVLEMDKTPVEFLAGRFTKEEVTKARTYMGGMKFTHEEMTGKIGALSGGQQAKILFLDMILKGSNVLLLDEPTRNFSPLSCPVVRAALRDFGGAVISVSHDRKYLDEVCDKVYELRENGLFPTETPI